MKLKIKNPKKNLSRILALASLVVQRGYIPTKEESENPELGRCYYLDDDKSRYHLFPMANDDWANIREQTEDYIVVEFSHRYDTGFKKKESLTNLIACWFGDCTEIV